MNKQPYSGFTLIELAIVILIIGLITGGIISGQFLVSQASLRSVINDVNQIKSAVNNFYLQYNALPGDLKNASSYWSTSNGNGNGYIDGTYNACGNPESLLAWRHLTLSESYPGNFTGTSSTPCAIIGTNIAGSKIKGGSYHLWSTPTLSGKIFNSFSGNFIHLGSYTTSDNSIMGAILLPSDGRDLDAKIDDGKANKGTVLASDGNGTTTGNCSARWNNNGGADYNLNYTSGNSCRLFFMLQ
jgi:prepilin-type N-terminal cleavage/methylation domain-containing protein